MNFVREANLQKKELEKQIEDGLTKIDGMQRNHKEFQTREGRLLDDITFLRRTLDKRNEEITLLKVKVKRGEAFSDLSLNQNSFCNPDGSNSNNEIMDSF